MKRKQPLLRLTIALIIASVSFTGCSSSHEEPGILPDEPEEPTPATDEYGLVAKDVRSYFASVINCSEATYSQTGDLTIDQINGASAYVWKLWKTALQRNSSERLPVLTSHYTLGRWDDIQYPDGTWNLPEGSMKFFYGSKGEKPSAGYPLFLFLHGSGSDAQEEWLTSLYWAQVFNEGSSAYFLPQSPQGGAGCRWYQPSRQEKWEQLLKQALISDNIDPLKIYFMGISEGAYGSQRLASFYADYLAGAGPIAGGELLTSCPPENLANLAYCMQTGEQDTSYGRMLLTCKVNTLLDELQSKHEGHYVHKVDIQPGKGHACDYTVTTPWLVNHTRKANPNYFYWENFGLGNINGEEMRYRDAFYNLYIVEPSDDRTNDLYRTAYEMNINGNTIELTVNNVTLTPSEPASGAGWTVNIGVDKTYTRATKGKVRIYLNNDLVDLSKPVTVKVNGSEKFNGTVTLDTRNLVESCALFYDPFRVFPASVEVSVQ